MIRDIKQTDKRLLACINKYGCYFLCLAEKSGILFQGDRGAFMLNGIWSKATELGYISGDINLDGDLDDAGEAEIQKVGSLLKEFFGLNYSYDGKHHNADEQIPNKVCFVIGMYYWKGSHFVILDKNKKVIFDPLGVSNTVKYGKLKTMRWFYAN